MKRKRIFQMFLVVLALACASAYPLLQRAGMWPVR